MNLIDLLSVDTSQVHDVGQDENVKNRYKNDLYRCLKNIPPYTNSKNKL